MRAGAFRALSIIALGHLAIELCTYFLPVIYPLLIERMGLTYTQIGTIALVAGTSTSLAQPLFGHLSDRWGAPRISVIGLIWIGVLMGLVGFTWSYPSLLVLVGLACLGSAAFHPPGAVLAAASSGERKGTGLSIFSLGGNLGSALSPLWMTLAIGALGLHGTATITPIALGVAFLLYLQFARTPLDQRPKSAAAPRNIGSNGVLVGLVLVIMATMFRSWFQVAFTTYLPVYVESTGGTLDAGAQLLSLFLFAASAGTLIGGALSDRFGRWQVMAASLSLLGPCYWLFLNSTGTAQVLPVPIMGALIGATFPVSIVLAHESWPRAMGVASALVMGLGWLPGGIGASFTGFIADRFSLFAGLQALLFAPVLAAACIFMYALVRRNQAAVYADRRG